MFIGLPGDDSGDRIVRCWGNINWFVTSSIQTYNNAVANRNRNYEEISADLYLTFDKGLNMVGNCNGLGEHIRSRVDMLKKIILDFMNSQTHLNNGEFFDSGKSLGFGISRMVA